MTQLSDELSARDSFELDSPLSDKRLSATDLLERRQPDVETFLRAVTVCWRSNLVGISSESPLDRVWLGKKGSILSLPAGALSAGNVCNEAPPTGGSVRLN